MRVWTILVAAGSGERFGGPKQFSPLGGQRVVDLAFETASAVSEKVVCVLPQNAGDFSAPEGSIAVPGGETRTQSVRNGLSIVPEDVEVILVHDGARPLASRALFERVIGEINAGAVAAIPGLTINDTLKRIEVRDEGMPNVDLTSIVNRDEIVSVQTPQAFSAPILREAYSQNKEATDDASLVELLGHQVLVVEGEQSNLKITKQEDLAAAEHWLQTKSVEA